MEVQPFLTTARLSIKPLTKTDDTFVLELVNSEGWIKFIGNRNVTSNVDARAYIQKILDSSNMTYWVVQLKVNYKRIGIVTFIKRDYLDHPDIGFAFLPEFCKKGLAYEATDAVLKQLIKERRVEYIYATTIPENVSSINLLSKIGLVFKREIEVGEQKLHVYGAPVKTNQLQRNTTV